VSGLTKTGKLLRDLIALPSVNPAFLPAGDPRSGEQRVAEFLSVQAAQAGLDLEFQKVLPGRSNIFARLCPSGKIRRRILLAPHLDTVGADDAQFRPVKRNGRLFGRGACDTKGSVAAMLSALMEVARSKPPLTGTEIIFAGLVDEESAQAGSRALAASGLKADLAIVGEPTSLQVVTAHKGNLWLRLEARGRSAHGARPELGRNAVHAMARIVDALETDYAAALRRKRHPLLGRATINVGTIHGGKQPNIVPDQCVITIDRRTLPGETDAGARRELAAFLRRRGFTVTIDAERTAPCFPLETNYKLPVVRQFLKSVGQRRPVGVHFFCDAAVLAEGGIPSVVFGPGDIAQAHTADEWISLTSLERAKEMLAAFFRSPF
jgi:acetylornithine deacetylase/succinyl-diaminopimelate desuccinylase-like protein